MVENKGQFVLQQAMKIDGVQGCHLGMQSISRACIFTKPIFSYDIAHQDTNTGLCVIKYWECLGCSNTF